MMKQAVRDPTRSACLSSAHGCIRSASMAQQGLLLVACFAASVMSCEPSIRMDTLAREKRHFRKFANISTP
jgi:hypothetical protein